MLLRLTYFTLAIAFSTYLQASEVTSLVSPDYHLHRPIDSRDLEALKSRINRGFSQQERLLQNQSTETIGLRNQVNAMDAFLQNLDAHLSEGINQLYLTEVFLVAILLVQFYSLRAVKKIIKYLPSNFQMKKKLRDKDLSNTLEIIKNLVRSPINIAQILNKKMNGQNSKGTVNTNISIEDIEVIKLELLSENVQVIEEKIEVNSSKSLLLKRGLTENLWESQHIRRKIKSPRPKKIELSTIEIFREIRPLPQNKK